MIKLIKHSKTFIDRYNPLIYNRPCNSYLFIATDLSLFTNAFLVISTVIVNERLDSVLTSNHVINIVVLGLATTAISL